MNNLIAVKPMIETEQAKLADKIGGVIVHRINFPKVLAGKMGRTACLSAKSRPLLTKEETEDVKGCVALVLCATGALQRGKLTLGDWKECFRAARGKDCLRIDRKAKNKSEVVRIDLMTPEALAILSVTESLPALSDAKRNVIARRIRYLRACALAALSAAKPNRQAKHNRKRAIRNLRFLASQYRTTGEGFSEIVDTDKDQNKRVADCMASFKALIAKGDAILTAESLQGIPFVKVRVLKSLSELV